MRAFAQKQNQPRERAIIARQAVHGSPRINATEFEIERRSQLTCACGGGCPTCQTAAPTAIYRQVLVDPPIVTQFREVGQLVPPAPTGLTPPSNQPVNAPPPTPTPEPTPRASPPPTGPSPQLVYFVMRHEGFYAHPDDVSDPYNCTVGYGNLLHHGTCVGNQSTDDPDYAAIERRFARGITQEQGLATLISRLMRDANRLLQRLTMPVSQNQLDALITFAFNPGGGLTTVIDRINSGDYAAVPGIMLRYAGAATTEGRMTHPRGLARRRLEEAAIWERGDYGYDTARRHHGCRRMIEDCSDPERPRPLVAAPPRR
jgi:GH24 family phage-related lysozyme (muramidase)